MKSLSKRKWQYKLVLSKKLNWNEYKKETRISSEEKAIKHYLKYWQDYDLVIPDTFDSKFYFSAYPDVKEAGINPLLHYFLSGRHEGRIGCAKSKKKDYDHNVYLTLLNCKEIDWSEYANENCSNTNENPVIHYMTNWRTEKTVFENFFDTEFYIESNPDIAKAGLNPLAHFLWTRATENRKGLFDLADYLEAGDQPYSESKKTLIVACHENSYTGAPLVGLRVGELLHEKYNIISVLLRKVSKNDLFSKKSSYVLRDIDKVSPGVLEFLFKRISEKYSVKGAVFSSVETVPIIDAVFKNKIPVVTLLHEYSDYTLPRGKITQAIYSSDYVIYPGEVVKKSGLDEFYHLTGTKFEPNHIRVLPQGKVELCDSSSDKTCISIKDKYDLDKETLLIYGAGYVQNRKGVDWFLDVARHIKSLASDRKVKFVWLGDGYDTEDLSTGVWLHAFIKNTGLEKDILFPGRVDCVFTALKEADIFLLTSKLDPFPNVAIDALKADCGIGCFESASGISDFLNQHNCRSVISPYGNTYHMAKQIIKNLDWLITKDGRNEELVSKHLDFHKYVDYIDGLLDSAERKVEMAKKLAKNEDFVKKFQSDYFETKPQEHITPYIFVNMLQKRIAFSKPYPGALIQDFLNSYTTDDECSFDMRAMKLFRGKEYDSDVLILDDNNNRKKFAGKVAVHIHVFYEDILLLFGEALKNVKEIPMDIILTSRKDIEKETIDVIKESISGNVFVEKVGNWGRDVFPFHVVYLKYCDKYDIIGHFHTKKSTDVQDGVGDRWRTYLINNLIASNAELNKLLSCFNDKETGLIYADDRHLVDEGENQESISELTSLLKLEKKENYYSFPLGTMFWARTNALSKLKELSIETFKLEEPIAYDGTVLHAFERLLPSIVEAEGFNSIKVYRPQTIW